MKRNFRFLMTTAMAAALALAAPAFAHDGHDHGDEAPAASSNGPQLEGQLAIGHRPVVGSMVEVECETLAVQHTHQFEVIGNCGKARKRGRCGGRSGFAMVMAVAGPRCATAKQEAGQGSCTPERGLRHF